MLIMWHMQSAVTFVTVAAATIVVVAFVVACPCGGLAAETLSLHAIDYAVTAN